MINYKKAKKKKLNIFLLYIIFICIWIYYTYIFGIYIYIFGIYMLQISFLLWRRVGFFSVQLMTLVLSSDRSFILCCCPSLRLICWAVCQWVVPSLLDIFAGNPFTVIEPRLFVEWAIWFSVFFCKWLLRSVPVRSHYVSSCQPLLCTGQAWDLELGLSFDRFSMWRLLASAYTSFSNMVKCAVIFSKLQLGHPNPT
jgi:hypothetical protein